MKCPYAVNRHVVQQIATEYGEDGAQNFQQTIEDNTAEFVDCLEAECGAWQNDRCCYRGAD